MKFLYRTRDYAFIISAIINKLVTIFADYTRTNNLINKTSNFLQNLLAAGRQDSDKSGQKTCIRICKNWAVPSLHQDTILAKVPRLYLVLRRVTLTNYTAGPLVVIDRLSRPENG
jgi:hypothetical protein